MTAELLNFNKARKARDRAAAKASASANRAKFGRPSAERAAQADERARAERLLDGHSRPSKPEPQD